MTVDSEVATKSIALEIKRSSVHKSYQNMLVRGI